MVIAALFWSDRLKGRYVTWWLDNDGARQGLVNGYSRGAKSARLIDEALLRLSFMGVFSWFARVPSEANIADMPSRLDWVKFESELPGARRREIGDDLWPRL